jgi:DNA polymerase
MSSKLWLDDETFSPTPITNGLHRYAEDVEILIRALALDDGPVIVQDCTPGGLMWELRGDDLISPDLAYVRQVDTALRHSDCEVYAHNSQFDRTVERWAGLRIPLHRWRIPLHRWRDTMVQALAHSLPGALGDLCEVLKLPTDKAKDKAGKALIQLFCKPVPFKFRKRAEGEKLADYKAAREAAEKTWNGRATRETHPAEWHQFLLYAGRDIEAMRAAHKIMPTWNYRGAELELWHLDQTINDRGVAIDVELAECAVNAVDEAQALLRERTAEITNGEVESATKRDAMLAHVLAEYGVELPDMQMATLERRIADPDLPEGLRELLRIRLQASTTSTSKYKTLIKGTSSDGRLRGLLQFCGAARTGRWAGRLWQPQNLPRPVLKQDEIDAGIDALKAGMANVLYDNVMQLTSSAIRGCIIAPPGKKLVVADLSNIEGRVLAWLAGERWKIKAFGEYDAGTGHDLYALSYAKSFGVTPESVMEDKKAGGSQRQVGKVQELALGYEGGVGAFVTFAAAYNIDLEKLAEIGSRAIPGEVWGRANIMYEWHQKQGRHPDAALGLSKKAWLTCESFKLGWRDAHQNVVQLWRDLDAAVRSAITRPGETFIVGVLRVRRDGAWLRIVLPSGRALCYPSPALVPEKKKRKSDECPTCEGGGIVQAFGWQGDIDPQATHPEVCYTCKGSGKIDLGDLDTDVSGGRTVITYMGVNQYSRKWDRLTTYGGKLVENVTQAVARDVMAANMPAIEAEMYEIVLTVHDEIICEAPEHEDWNHEHLAALMATVPPWAAGLPLAAAGFEATRYRKD